MRKYIALFMALVCILSLCSCGWNSQKAVAAVISENVTKIDIIHRIGGETTNWSVEGAEIDLLREWLGKLDYKHLKVKEGQSPGDSDGGEVYTFVLTGDEWPDFSYVINGENDCYIQSEGNWFSVTNPTTPPIGSHSNKTANDILADIVAEGIVSARFDSHIPNYIYDIEDLTIVDELLTTLDGATYEVCERPKEPWGSIEAIYITTNENEYYLGVIENSAFRVSVNGEGEYYTCSHKDNFLNKLLELQGR